MPLLTRKPTVICRNIAVGEAAAHDPRKKNLLNLRSNVLKSNLSIYSRENTDPGNSSLYTKLQTVAGDVGQGAWNPRNGAAGVHAGI